MRHQKKIAIVLFNLGGPDKLSSVKPFLFNLFNDKAIINLPQPLRFFLAKFISSRREKKAQKIYSQIGGKSPLLEITEAQAHTLEKELSFFGEFKVFVAMRYWHPMSQKVVADVLSHHPQKVILLPLYPQFSTSTTQSSFDDFSQKLAAACQKSGAKIEVKKVCCYFKEPEFITAHAKLIEKTISKLYEKNLGDFRFLFSAHGLPQKLIDQGDPYVFQVEESTKKIVENLRTLLFSKNKTAEQNNIDFKVCYQSKVGPLQWTGPSLDHEIRRVALDKKIPVIIPIAFVSEHSETLVELDIDYKNLAKTLGIENYLRVPALNIDGHFIASLTKICREVSQSDGDCFSGCKTKRNCDAKFKNCPNNYKYPLGSFAPASANPASRS